MDDLIESHNNNYENLKYTNVFEPLEHDLSQDRVKVFLKVYKEAEDF